MEKGGNDGALPGNYIAPHKINQVSKGNMEREQY
jgi:hypothetical protein